MVGQITYQIRFPLGAEFQNDPKYLFIKKIYFSIKKVICMNSEIKICEACNKKEKCLYYFLSGENFKGFPAILVDRQLLEKKKYKKHETLELTFYLIGIAFEYIDFITEYFNETIQISNHFFQKKLICQNYLDDSKLYHGKLKGKTLLTDVNEIKECLEYYNKKYNCKYIIPKINNAFFDFYIRDFNYYQINLKKFYLNGYKMTIEVDNYPNIFMTIGIGKNAFLGGGKFSEN